MEPRHETASRPRPLAASVMLPVAFEPFDEHAPPGGRSRHFAPFGCSPSVSSCSSPESGAAGRSPMVMRSGTPGRIRTLDPQIRRKMVTSSAPIQRSREVAVEWQAIRAISGTGENNSSKRAPSSGALEHQPNQACAPHLLPAKGHRDHPARPGAVVSLLGEHRVELGVQVVVGFTGLQPQRHPVPGSVLLQAARRGEPAAGSTLPAYRGLRGQVGARLREERPPG